MEDLPTEVKPRKPGTFEPGNNAAQSKGRHRRTLTERLTVEFLEANGKNLFMVLLECAQKHEDLEARSRAADRLLKHLLLHPKKDEDTEDEVTLSTEEKELLRLFRPSSVEAKKEMAEIARKDEKKRKRQLESSS